MSDNDGLLITSEYQSHGHGQGERSWQSQAGENLLLSLILHPTFLSPRKLFLLSIAASLSLYDLLSSLSLVSLRIKWPNDIYVDQKKVAGLLIDSKLQGRALRYVIIGIGLNVNQQHIDLPRATSLSVLLGKRLHKEELLEAWSAHFGLYYLSLRKAAQHAQLRQTFSSLLLGRDKLTHFVSTPKSVAFSATIQGIDTEGRLQLRTSRGIQLFSPGTLQHLWS